VTNPPYGERLPVARAAAIFRRLGDWLKLRCGGWRAAVLAPAATAKAIGLKPHRRLPLANGPIDCRLVELVVRQRTEPPPSPAEAEPGGAAAAVPDSAHLPAAGRTVADQLGDFRRRLAKRAKHLGRWARRQGIEAYRLYDRDIPEIPLVIDRYGDYLHAAEYERPHDRTAIEHDVWLDRMVEAAAAELGVASDRVFLKTRRRQRAGGQYEKVDDRQATLAVAEAGLQFEVNLSDYLDTGLFLDHRPTRALVRGEAAGRRLLNLFCYTGSFSVAAAAGKAATTTSLDLSNTYLDWTRRNLAANGFVDRRRHDRGRPRRPPTGMCSGTMPICSSWWLTILRLKVWSTFQPTSAGSDLTTTGWPDGTPSGRSPGRRSPKIFATPASTGPGGWSGSRDRAKIVGSESIVGPERIAGPERMAGSVTIAGSRGRAAGRG